jgi:hypothetical protein
MPKCGPSVRGGELGSRRCWHSNTVSDHAPSSPLAGLLQSFINKHIHPLIDLYSYNIGFGRIAISSLSAMRSRMNVHSITPASCFWATQNRRRLHAGLSCELVASWCSSCPQCIYMSHCSTRSGPRGPLIPGAALLRVEPIACGSSNSRHDKETDCALAFVFFTGS